VLWIEDDHGLHRYAQRLLGANGFEVEIAETAAEGFQQLASGEHSVVIIDERLGNRSGLEVLRRARSVGSAVPAIVLTGFGTPESVCEAVQLGVIDYQCKPGNSERILAALRTATRVGRCCPHQQRAPVPHSDASLPLVAVFMSLEYADECQLRTQLAWAAADEHNTFAELAGAILALRRLVAEPPEPESALREYLHSCLQRCVETRVADFSGSVTQFLNLIKTDRDGVRALTDDGVADLIGVTVARLSQRTHEELGLSPRACRLIAEMQPALRQLAHSPEQIAQIGYQLGIMHHSAFDRLFRRALGIVPSEYRRLLTGAAT
jgi:ActR/RegA family two-component response regulator/AraC-like DNA-binding protein